MQVREPQFDVEVTMYDLAAIRAAIRKWGKPAPVAESYTGLNLYHHLCGWSQFVDTDWVNWDQSEYNHDIGCRTWIQLAIEYSSAQTAARIRAAVAPVDDRFRGYMRRAKRVTEATPILRKHPYFWETHTLHPDLVASTA
ncbi:MAG: hypothetical protein CVU65_14815 [Deltaproteobacteria bacterium HGW-Deltaproteobacteria-22]|jgi:hypothetical protein|nr:MAG: hypothetical protein CVU65_14815 [Deltaproteobacteria bacterium HGW-Deltaproteobacteria-22]